VIIDVVVGCVKKIPYNAYSINISVGAIQGPIEVAMEMYAIMAAAQKERRGVSKI
jgi:hypothetical protein